QTTDQSNVEYGELKSESQLQKLVKQAKGNEIGVVICAPPAAAVGEENQDDEPELPLLNIRQQGCDPVEIAISAEENRAVSARLGDNAVSGAIRNVLADQSIPKSVHDYKSSLRLLFKFVTQTVSSLSTAAEPRPRAAVPQGQEDTAQPPLAGVRDDVMLFSYLLNPTYSSHTLPEVALRRFNLQLSGMTAEAADVTLRLARTLRKEVE